MFSGFLIILRGGPWVLFFLANVMLFLHVSMEAQGQANRIISAVAEPTLEAHTAGRMLLSSRKW